MTRPWTGFAFAAALLCFSCDSGDRPAATATGAAETAAAATPKAAAPTPAAPTPTAAEVEDAGSVVVPATEEARMDIPKVFVNGRELSSAQLDAFKQIYRVVPAPGHWWYDAISGMYGAEGQGATGFMYPGHDFGPLPADASRGTMPVFINGRQLTQVEVNYLAWLAGGAVAPGRYWVDAQLNWGYEGVPMPAGNLRMLAAARGGGGGRGGSGGDNTWSGLVGSGNYTDDNSAGYVSIPGVGPIASYGM